MKGLILLAAILGALPAASRAGEAEDANLFQEAGLLPAETGLLLAMDVGGFRSSKVRDDLGREEALANTGVLAEFQGPYPPFDKTTTGINIETDVEEMACGAVPSDVRLELVCVARGRFDEGRISAAFEAWVKKAGARYTRRLVGQTTVSSNGRAAIAVLNGHAAVFGKTPLVEAAAEAYSSGQRPLEGAPVFASLSGVPLTRKGVVIEAGPMLERLFKTSAPSRPIPTALRVIWQFDAGLEIALEMPTPAEAAEWADGAGAFLGGPLRRLLREMPELATITSIVSLASTFAVGSHGTRLLVTTGPSGAEGLVAAAMTLLAAHVRDERIAANEALAIWDLRALWAGESAYSRVGELFGEPACLYKPSSCLPQYKGTVLLNPAIPADGVRSGYRRAFFAGPGKDAKKMTSFAYTATPTDPGQTGRRSFCVDSFGRVRVDPGGDEIKPVEGLCPTSLAPLEGTN